MNTKEKTIIGVSSSVALLLAALTTPKACNYFERALVVTQTRDSAELQIKAALQCSSLKARPCEPGPVLRDGRKIPILDAHAIQYQCGEVPVVCQKFPSASRVRPSSEDYYCFVPLSYQGRRNLSGDLLANGPLRLCGSFIGSSITDY